VPSCQKSILFYWINWHHDSSMEIKNISLFFPCKAENNYFDISTFNFYALNISIFPSFESSKFVTLMLLVHIEMGLTCVTRCCEMWWMNIPFTRKYNGSILGCCIKWLALKIINLLITKDEKENIFHPWLIITSGCPWPSTTMKSPGFFKLGSCFSFF